MAVGGEVKGDCLKCPFHSWSFRGDDGRCESIPYAEKGFFFFVMFHLIFVLCSKRE